MAIVGHGGGAEQADTGNGGLLARSDERDLWHARVLGAWREGWQARAGDYDRGYVDGILARKHLEHDAVEAARIELARWGPGGREHFGDPRPGDFAGRGAA